MHTTILQPKIASCHLVTYAYYYSFTSHELTAFCNLPEANILQSINTRGSSGVENYAANTHSKKQTSYR